MINYYFNLNSETKKYLLKFQDDFCLEPLEDLTLYKEDEIKFYSCTHEGFNTISVEQYKSIENDYKNMTNDEILDFIND